MTARRSIVNVPAEWSFRLAHGGRPGSADVNVVFSSQVATYRVPAYWGGDDIYRARFAAQEPGRHEWALEPGNATPIEGETIGSFIAEPYCGENPLYDHGRLQMDSSGRGLEHRDGCPFFWLGDTWWAGLSPRLSWPHDFHLLVNDRVKKGFSVIQLVVGPWYPASDVWHPDQQNEAGWSWNEEWSSLNSAYYDAADRRIAALVDSGLVPCILGMWGEHLPMMGIERVRQHWRNLIARYAAYPVVFCICGEANVASLTDTVQEQRTAWSQIAAFVHETDPFRNPLTVHPGYPDSRAAIDDEAFLDVNMLQTTHFGYHEPSESLVDHLQASMHLDNRPTYGLRGAVATVVRAVNQSPYMPVINGEPAYEGHWGANWQDVQRFLLWTNMLSGAIGHTYGAQGLWNMKSETPLPGFWGGESQDGDVWPRQGSGTWRDAMNYAGGRQVGIGRAVLEQYSWWQFEPMFQSQAECAGREWSFAAGIPGEVIVFYFGSKVLECALQGLPAHCIVPLDSVYRAYFVDPRTGARIMTRDAIPDGTGQWRVPTTPTDEDWVLILESAGNPVGDGRSLPPKSVEHGVGAGRTSGGNHAA